MLSFGVSPDNYTFPLKACSSAKALEAGQQAHAFALKLGLADNVFVRPTLINMYAECGVLLSARVLFERDDWECLVSYNSMITACVSRSRPGEALVLFRELQGKGMRPADVTNDAQPAVGLRFVGCVREEEWVWLLCEGEYGLN